MRWKRRVAAGDLPVKSPGPKKIEPFYLGELSEKIDQLCHGKKRTQGTGELYESYQGVISRREFNQMVIAVRRDRQGDRVAALHQVHWQRPDVVWAIDGTEHKTEFADKDLHV